MPSREKCWFADHSFVVTGRVRLRSGTIHPSYPESQEPETQTSQAGHRAQGQGDGECNAVAAHCTSSASHAVPVPNRFQRLTAL